MSEGKKSTATTIGGYASLVGMIIYMIGTFLTGGEPASFGGPEMESSNPLLQAIGLAVGLGGGGVVGMKARDHNVSSAEAKVDPAALAAAAAALLKK